MATDGVTGHRGAGPPGNLDWCTQAADAATAAIPTVFGSAPQAAGALEQRAAVAASSESWYWIEPNTVEPKCSSPGTANSGNEDMLSASSAVAGVPNAVIPLEVFKDSDFNFNGSYRQHSAALKYFREDREDSTDPFNPSRILRFPNDAPVQIPTIPGGRVRSGLLTTRKWLPGLGRK